MSTKTPNAWFIVVMIGVILAVDLTFFRHHLWWRLIANIAIVAVFLGLYAALRR